MDNLIISIDEVIDDENNLDVWIIFETYKDLDKYNSLYNLLWNISFDPSKVNKSYHVEHSIFYQMIQRDGIFHLMQLIKTVCELCKVVVDSG